MTDIHGPSTRQQNYSRSFLKSFTERKTLGSFLADFRASTKHHTSLQHENTQISLHLLESETAILWRYTIPSHASLVLIRAYCKRITSLSKTTGFPSNEHRCKACFFDTTRGTCLVSTLQTEILFSKMICFLSMTLN